MARCSDIDNEIMECTEMCVEEVGEVFRDECRRDCRRFVEEVCRGERRGVRGG